MAKKSKRNKWNNIHWQTVQSLSSEAREKLKTKLDNGTKKRLIAEKIDWYLISIGAYDDNEK